MAINYPTSLDTSVELPNPAAGDHTNSPSHAGLHDNENAAIIALETKLGTGSSTAASTMLLRGTGSGTSAWDKVAPTGTIVGTSDSQTLTSKTLTAPIVTNPTITGGGSWTGSPTLSTPTIADFTNAGHNHSNAAGGGNITKIDKSVLTTDSNPYKFHVSRSAAANTGASAFAVIAYDTEQFDTNNNVASGVYTAPVNGFYQFNWQGSTTTTGTQEVIASLFKNGSEIARGARTTGTSVIIGVGGSDFIQLTAGDTVDVRMFCGTARPLDVGLPVYNYFSGFLVSRT